VESSAHDEGVKDTPLIASAQNLEQQNLSPERADQKAKGKDRSKSGNSIEGRSLQEVSIAFGANLAKIYVVAT